MLLRAILYQTPDSDERLRERTSGLLNQLESDPSLGSGVLEGLLR
jgi:hypothetical protein